MNHHPLIVALFSILHKYAQSTLQKPFDTKNTVVCASTLVVKNVTL